MIRRRRPNHLQYLLTLVAALFVGLAPLAGCDSSVEEGIVEQSEEPSDLPEDY
ncbi:hypothetical protein [Alienimonas sp. DA493]|uniref:hypothetical protein n=1 Tax=Alienimonas sp. DA493 TaxID=3373605 RepID=UPI003754F300